MKECARRACYVVACTGGCVTVLALFVLLLRASDHQGGIAWQATTLRALQRASASDIVGFSAASAQKCPSAINVTCNRSQWQAPQPTIAQDIGNLSHPEANQGSKQSAPQVQTPPRQAAPSAERWHGVQKRHPDRHRSVALCFYGLTRSLTYTIQSIRINLIAPLERAGYNVNIYLHTYNLAYLRNDWSREHSALNTTEWRLLDPLEAEVSSQEEFLAARREDIRRCEQQGSPWPMVPSWNQTLHNHLLQLNSLQRVAALWQSRNPIEKYQAVVYARPDVLFSCPLPVHLLAEMPERTLFVPNHDHYGGYNDRFAMGRPTTAAIYGARLKYTLDRCKGPVHSSNRAHAETNVKRLVNEKHLGVYEMPRFYFFRVRANGVAEVVDLRDKPACNRTLLDDVFFQFRGAQFTLNRQVELAKMLVQ